MIIKNDKLVKALLKQQKVVEDYNKKLDELEKASEEFEKAKLKFAKMKDKVTVITNEVRAELRPTMGEYEEIISVNLKDGELIAEIGNLKEVFYEQADKQFEDFVKQTREYDKTNETKPDGKEDVGDNDSSGENTVGE